MEEYVIKIIKFLTPWSYKVDIFFSVFFGICLIGLFILKVNLDKRHTKYDRDKFMDVVYSLIGTIIGLQLHKWLIC
jgi:hypothetical protein